VEQLVYRPGGNHKGSGFKVSAIDLKGLPVYTTAKITSTPNDSNLSAESCG